MEQVQGVSEEGWELAHKDKEGARIDADAVAVAWVRVRERIPVGKR